MSPASLLRIWKQDGWIRRLSGLTYEPSTAKAGVEKLIASLPDTPASRSVSRGKNALPMTPATSGHTSPVSPASVNPSGAFSRTSPTIYRWDLNRSAMTWTAWVTKLRRVCLARKKWVRRTAASGCSSWPTVRVSSANGPSSREIAAGNPKQRLEVGVVNWTMPDSPSNLGTQSLWPTPRAQEPGSTSEHYSMGLAETIKVWPTITAQDAKNNGGASQFQRNTKPLNVEATLHCSHPTQTATGAVSQPTLNPAFTEWLMGWPIGWTASEPAVTGWYRWQQHMHGALSALVSIRTEHERLANSTLPA